MTSHKRRQRDIKLRLLHRRNLGDYSVIKDVVIYNTYLKDFLFPFLVRPGIVIDIGAHIGAFTVQACLTLKPNAVVAVEPERSNFDYLQRNLSRFGLAKLVRPYQIALWDRDGKLRLYLQKLNTGGHSLLRQKAIVERAKLARPDTQFVAVKTLDNLLADAGFEDAAIRVVKIDAEGAEVHILRGASKALRRTAVVVGELHEGVVSIEQFRRCLNGFALAIGEPVSPLRTRIFWAVNCRLLRAGGAQADKFFTSARIADLSDVLRRFRDEKAGLQKELEERTRWTLQLDKELKERDAAIRQLQKELEERTQWALQLDKELKERDAAIRQLQKELEERTQWALQLDKELQETRRRVIELQQT